MKLGVIPYFIPRLLTRYLNSRALSATRRAVVYARAVSKTPGPVSVSVQESAHVKTKLLSYTHGEPQGEVRTPALRRIYHENSHYSAGFVVGNSRALPKKSRLNCESWYHGDVLPGVRGCKPTNFFSARLCGVSSNVDQFAISHQIH